MDVDTEPTEPQRVQELWFEDGNLVIEAGKSRYRVYRGVLATRSSVFQDMLAFPQPPDSELVEGCPFVRLTDSESEVTSFLKALFEPEFFMPFPALTELDIIVGCLRLSHKYGVDYLRRRALVHLSSGYRTTLSQYDAAAYYSEKESDPSISPSEIRSWDAPDDNWTHVVTAIQLAREVDAPWILPSAFYDLAFGYNILGAVIFQGVVRNGVRSSMNEGDRLLFSKGHLIQHASSTTEILRFLFHPSEIPHCESAAKCLSIRLDAMETMRERLLTVSCGPLEIWGYSQWKLLENICPMCFDILRDLHRDARQELWDKLPTIYGLPSWQELEEQRDNAIGVNVFG
ncbi:hypothetical protein B0H19DRAFT_1374367 [Mycena capillaripes]|nr:hypothetical protein B0H19DRAFT_1374367 [Mycena capillaripes]